MFSNILLLVNKDISNDDKINCIVFWQQFIYSVILSLVGDVNYKSSKVDDLFESDDERPATGWYSVSIILCRFVLFSLPI